MTYSVTSSAPVGAPPNAVYEIIADYHRRHPRIATELHRGPGVLDHAARQPRP